MKAFIVISVIWCIGLVVADPILGYFSQTHYFNTLGLLPFPERPLNISKFAGGIRICSFQVYGFYNNTFELQSKYNVAGLLMWEYLVNNVREPPGLLLNGQRYYVNVTTINVGFDTVSTQNVTYRAIRDKEWGDFDMYVAPWATAKALDIAPITEEFKKPFITPWASFITAFVCPVTGWQNLPGCVKASDRRYKYMWGLVPTAELYWDAGINLLKIKGASTFGCWCLNDTYSKAIIGGAQVSADRGGLKILTPSLVNNYDWNTLNVPPNLIPTNEQLYDVFNRLKVLDPDIVICGNRVGQTCADIVRIMKDLDYQPRAIGATQCLQAAAGSTGALSGTDLRYFMESSVWDVNVHGAAFTDVRDFVPTNVSSSSQRFNQTYYDLVGESPLWYAVGTYLAGYAFELCLEAAGTLDPDTMNKNFAFNLETTFFGSLGYNSFGYNDKLSLLTVQLDNEKNVKIVYPSGTATNDLVFPFVSWSARTFRTAYLGLTSEKIIFALFILAVAYSGFCLILLIKYWHSRSVEASSPTFLTIMLVGSFLLYSTVPSWMIHVDEGGVSCHLRFWFLCLGFTLLFGTLVAKTHRIQSLFFLKKMRPKKFTDTKLLRYVGAMVAFDVFLCILWSAITRPERYKVIREGLGVENGHLWENNNFVDCDWNKTPGAMTAFLALEGSYKTVMVAYGLYLSVSLWKYGSSMWVESKQIIFSMYNLIVFALIGLALQLSLGYTKDRQTLEVLFVTRSVCILISGVITIGAILVPRFFDPDGKAHQGKDTTGTKRTIDTAAVQLNDLEFKYEMLEKKYNDLKKKYREACPDEKLSEDAEE